MTEEIDKTLMGTCSPYTLMTVLHECYHAYEYTLVRAYNRMDENYKAFITYNDVSVYEYEFEHYISGENNKNREAYEAQYCERDADAYAKERIEEYILWLEDEAIFYV